MAWLARSLGLAMTGPQFPAPRKAPRHSLTSRIRSLFRASMALRFLFVGGLNTLASYLMYLFLLWIGLFFPVANFGSLLFGISLGFLLQGHLVFRDTDLRKIFPFLGSWMLIYFAQTGLIWLFVREGVKPSIAGLFALPFVVVSSYLVQKFVVFRRRRAAR